MTNSPQSSPLEVLADQISASAKIIAAFCASTGHPHPSFDDIKLNGLNTLPCSAPAEIQEARQVILENAYRLEQLIIEPNQYLARLAVYPQHLAAIQWLCHFKIPSLVPSDSNISYPDLAAAAHVPLHQLKSITRMAITGNFLQEKVLNQVSHSKTSAHFVSNPSLCDWALFLAEDSAPMAPKLVEATLKWGETTKKTETAFNLALKTDLPFFDYLSSSPEFTQRFSGYMKNVAKGEGTNIKHLIQGYDWANLGNATVVDVGGSSGHASISLAEIFPQLKFIVQDLPMVIKTSVSQVPDAVSSRVTFQSHDFFTPQPVIDGDVYLLRMILHDWPRDEAQKILSHLAAALIRLGGRILVMDTVLPNPGSAPVSEEALLRVRDMTMMQTFNSHERGMEEWEALVQAADSTLKIIRAIQPVGSAMTILEIGRD
ncbi:uncharacterized protein N7446_001349 [Penicillium canescens]|uniref:O-methyltransferase C-terminal domain-containing protein n=1 Tax=Penicillium canescens TaxID=5083 RepID=A0AAD6N8F7_PENCN|nr:uncharacterized protein N7446_001349 [Penicillium canescens]KAJ6043153.1 hypothetical protein N7460_004508 [Penicillium canescens]KAJ6054628.1 hypothetical protein N7444_003726 [Penicillium canescens]KAJ6073572.1 hypothetical protein N7446_001349 [Penicillium canescens]